MLPSPCESTSRRAAELRLRGTSGTLPVSVLPPAATPQTPGVAVLYQHGVSAAATEPVTAVLRDAGLLVVCAHSARTAGEAVTTAEWVAGRGHELGADPGRLVVAGVGRAASLAVSVAVEARDNGWPPIAAQLLVMPKLAGWAEVSRVDGVAPAIVVRPPGACGAASYLERLHVAGVAVEEIRLDLSDPDGLESGLARALGRVLP